jgi:aminomethyltransferase
VQIEDISTEVAAIALQGPTSGRLLLKAAEGDVANLKYFRLVHGKIGGVEVDISRTGYTGDLGYEIWMAWKDAPRVWDALMEHGRQFDVHAAGMLALDVARIEAGLIMIEVDYTSSKRALIESQKYSPYELGLGKMVDLKKEHFIGREALVEEHKRGPKRLLMGLDINWEDVERIYDSFGLGPQVQSDFDDVGTDVEENGGAGEFEPRACDGWDRIADGTDRGGCASQGAGGGAGIAVL